MASIVALNPKSFLGGSIVALTPPEVIARLGESTEVNLSVQKLNVVSADAPFFTYLISEKYAKDARESYQKTKITQSEIEGTKTQIEGIRDDTSALANSAQTNANNAKASELKAKEWAIKDTAVENNDFSSKHYANESKNNKDSAAQASQSATEAATRAEAAANSIVNPLVDKGQFDPRGGNYPAKPDQSCVWYCVAKASINGIDWDVGDFLTYSHVNDQFAKLTGDPVGTTTPQPFTVPDDLIMNPKKAIRFKETPTDNDPMYAVGLHISKAGDKRLIVGDKDNTQQTELTLFNYDANKIYAVEAIQGDDDEPVKKIPILTGKNGYLKTEIDEKLATKVSKTDDEVIEGKKTFRDGTIFNDGTVETMSINQTDHRVNIRKPRAIEPQEDNPSALVRKDYLDKGLSGRYTKTESDAKYALQDQDNHSVQYARWLRPQDVNISSLGSAFKAYTHGTGQTGFPYTYGSGLFVPRESGQNHYGWGIWNGTATVDLKYYKQKADGSGADFYTIYHSGNKPTPAAIGALTKADGDKYYMRPEYATLTWERIVGGDITKAITPAHLQALDLSTNIQNDAKYVKLGGSSMTGDLHFAQGKGVSDSGQNHLLTWVGTNFYSGNVSHTLNLRSKTEPVLTIGSHNYSLYHTGHKPSAHDVGAVAKTGDTMTGKLRMSGANASLWFDAGAGTQTNMPSHYYHNTYSTSDRSLYIHAYPSGETASYNSKFQWRTRYGTSYKTMEFNGTNLIIDGGTAYTSHNKQNSFPILNADWNIQTSDFRTGSASKPAGSGENGYVNWIQWGHSGGAKYRHTLFSYADNTKGRELWYAFKNNGTPSGNPSKYKIYHTGSKPSKADVGLSNVPNYAFTYAVNDSSKTKFASAYGVKLAYDKAVAAYLPQTWRGGVGNNADSYTSGCKVGFSYGGNTGHTPYAGTLISLHSQSGYGTQINTTYSGGNNIAFRTYNGDHKTWNAWHEIYHVGRKPTPAEIGAQPHHAKLDGLVGSLTDFGGQDIRIRGKRALVGSTGNLLINYSNDFAKTEVMSDLQVDKNITASANITAYSDERLKDNIKPIENALEKVNKIGGYSYHRTDLEGTKQVGVLAQEIEKVLPEVVHNNEDGYKSVSYGNISALLIEAIKEQSKQIETLQDEVQALKGGA